MNQPNANKDPNPNYKPPVFKTTGFTAVAEINGTMRTVQYDPQVKALAIECTLAESREFIVALQVPQQHKQSIEEFANMLKDAPAERKIAFVKYIMGEAVTDITPQAQPAPNAPGVKRPQVPGGAPGVTRSARAPTAPAPATPPPSSGGAHPRPTGAPNVQPSSASSGPPSPPPPQQAAPPPQQPAPAAAPVAPVQPPQPAAPPQPVGTRNAVQAAAQAARDAHPDRGAPPNGDAGQKLMFEPEPGVHVRDAGHKGQTVPDGAAAPAPHQPQVMDYSAPPQGAQAPQQRPGMDPARAMAAYDQQAQGQPQGAPPNGQSGNALDAALGLAPPAAQAPPPQQPAPQQAAPAQAPVNGAPVLPPEVAQATKLTPLFAWLYEQGHTTKEAIAERAYALREQIPYVSHVNNLEGRAERWLEMVGESA